MTNEGYNPPLPNMFSLAFSTEKKKKLYCNVTFSWTSR